MRHRGVVERAALGAQQAAEQGIDLVAGLIDATERGEGAFAGSAAVITEGLDFRNSHQRYAAGNAEASVWQDSTHGHQERKRPMKLPSLMSFLRGSPTHEPDDAQGSRPARAQTRQCTPPAMRGAGSPLSSGSRPPSLSMSDAPAVRQHPPRLPPNNVAGEAQSRRPTPADLLAADPHKLGKPAPYSAGSAKRQAPLQPHEAQQAAYQLAARLHGEAITDPAERARLAEANQVVHDTRLVLRHGRGNIAADVGPSEGYSRILSSVAYNQGGPLFARAAMTMAVGAGYCDQHAEVNALDFVPKLKSGEAVETRGGKIGKGIAHAWAEVKPATGQPVVMDSWASGPAVRLKHSALHSRGDAMLRMTGSEADRNVLKRRDENYRELVPGGADFEYTQDVIADRVVRLNQIAQLRPAHGQSNWDNFAEQQIVSPKLAQTARTQLERMPPLHAEIAAVGAGRDAYNLSVHAATRPHATAAILTEATRLDQLSRPAVSAPPLELRGQAPSASSPTDREPR